MSSMGLAAAGPAGRRFALPAARRSVPGRTGSRVEIGARQWIAQIELQVAPVDTDAGFAQSARQMSGIGLNQFQRFGALDLDPNLGIAVREVDPYGDQIGRASCRERVCQYV